ncbi:hypothetical protein M422DRAFT_192828 [Sphaerobolus stellatus SS14]|uniref:CxC2-like cysteine cluster KDZ transposase-associated domain-containing protein n=1 Tax=Sphaerobolus stellatus (strain SS14) TaxID=990650 RepID=A0A0C9UA62_SPHS4|nr:hypothetical protein M422DRAFT_192828 [Sphaerobolus stellatus SS14]
MYLHEAPIDEKPICLQANCKEAGAYDCVDCDAPGYWCRECLIEDHQYLPFHRINAWDGNSLRHVNLKELGMTVSFGHELGLCPHMATEGGPQDITILDVTGIHSVRMAWCRCAAAPTQAEQLFERKWFPATLQRPRTAISFRVLKLFHLLNHVARTNPWDFAGTMHRLTDNVCPTSVTDIYKPFKHVQRQWRVVRAWKRGGVRDPALPRLNGSLAMWCVSCPIPGVNLDPGWQQHPDSDLIHTVFIGVDGNFRLRRHNKGGGEKADPSLFGNDAYYAPHPDYKMFCRVRGGAPDDMADMTCRMVKAGEPQRRTVNANRPTNGNLSNSCVRSGAFAPKGTVDIILGERYGVIFVLLRERLIGRQFCQC